MLNAAALCKAAEGCDWVIACLSGDSLGQAKAIASALDGAHVGRVVWMTGLGVQHEVPGPMGAMLAGYARRQPDFVEAARIIDACPTPSLLVRAPLLTDGPARAYCVHRPGEPVRGDRASRATVARFIVDAVEGRIPLEDNESLGVTDA